MYRAMTSSLCLVKAHTACEDEIGAGEQRFFKREQLARGAAKQGELIHVVVDDEIGFKIGAEGQRHWRVVPGDARPSRRAPDKSPTRLRNSRFPSSGLMPSGSVGTATVMLP